MREISIGGRTISVAHVDTEVSEYGGIQRYRIDVSGSYAATHLSHLSRSPAIDAHVTISTNDAELSLEYDGSVESGLLPGPAIRDWRDQNREPIEGC